MSESSRWRARWLAAFAFSLEVGVACDHTGTAPGRENAGAPSVVLTAKWVSTSPRPESPEQGEFLGGFFADAKGNGAGCSYRTTVHLKTYRDYSTGFRCCRDANKRGG